MNAIDLTNAALLLGSALVIAGILSSLIAKRFGAPMLLVFLGVGMLAGEDGPGGIVFSDYRFSYLVGSLALAIILFDGGLRTRLSMFRNALVPAGLLATVGVLITAGLCAVAAFYVLRFNPTESFLLGAIVAPTDAAAIFFLLKTQGIQLRHRMSALIEIESGTNDPVAVFLVFSTVAIIAAKGALSGGDVVLSLFEEAAIGAVVGIGGGVGIVAALNRLNLPNGLHPLLALSGSVLVFAVAAVAGGSGFLAAYLAGLVVGNRPVRAYASIISLNDAITWLAQIVMFLVLGLLVTPHRLMTYGVPALGVALFVIFVARPVAVWICLYFFRFDWREMSFISWAGLRGAVSIFLAAVPTLAHLPLSYIYFDVAFFVVVFSLVLQGWTTRWMAIRLKQVVPRVASGSVQRVEIDLPGQTDVEIVGYPILPDSRILSLTTMPKWVRMTMVARGGEVLEPAEAGRLKAGDYAYFLAPTLRVPRLDNLFVPLAERSSAIDTEWEFSIHGNTRLTELATLYDLKLPPDIVNLTVAELFAERFETAADVGDSLPVGVCILTVTALDGDDVVEATLHFDRETSLVRGGRLSKLMGKLTGRAG
ncbi:MAG TPA: potassium/proton antiporter [Rhizomicrobium sp.]|jgi:cell volume regulation protein A|nr:potassium/proton antiporter [Rhizomicrobium sp.]